MNTSLEHCSESRSEEQGLHRVVVLDVDDEAPDLFQIVHVKVTLIHQSDHRFETALAIIIEGWLPVQINSLPQISADRDIDCIGRSILRGEHEDIGSACDGDNAPQVRWVEDAGEIACRGCSYGSNGSSSVAGDAVSDSPSSKSSLRTIWCL